MPAYHERQKVASLALNFGWRKRKLTWEYLYPIYTLACVEHSDGRAGVKHSIGFRSEGNAGKIGDSRMSDHISPCERDSIHSLGSFDCAYA